MNLDSVTVGHDITVDLGPDRRSLACKVWDWLQDKQPDYGIRYFGLSLNQEVRWQEHRANLALRHLTDETLDGYIFDRLTCDERHPIKHHLKGCPQCAKTIQQRETMATWIKSGIS